LLRITVKREELGWSRAKLGIRADVNPVHVGQLELGRLPKVWPGWRKRLSHALGACEGDLFDRDGRPIEQEG
jgi:hypothetical protein